MTDQMTVTMIHGEVRTLTMEELHGATQFHRSRIPFLEIGPNLVINLDQTDMRDHWQWASQDFQITPEQFECLDRGYMMPGRIQLFRGSSFQPILDPQAFLKNHGEELLACYHCIIDTRPYPCMLTYSDVYCYNGVQVGEIGTIWPPIQKVARIIHHAGIPSFEMYPLVSQK